MSESLTQRVFYLLVTPASYIIVTLDEWTPNATVKWLVFFLLLPALLLYLIALGLALLVAMTIDKVRGVM